jgi:hypothetical protein
MVTKRTPLRRRTKTRISDAALRIFREMQDIECTCGPVRKHPPECHGCKRWDALHEQLVEALRWNLETWQATCIPSPDGGGWHDDLAVQLQCDLEAALAERSPGTRSAQ